MQVALTESSIVLYSYKTSSHKTMASSSTRQRLIQSALTLFTSGGISAATTRQIAEAADVNEVTLFRQFGNKQGLILAVIEESEGFESFGSIVSRVPVSGDVSQLLRDYASATLEICDRSSELLRSFFGESDATIAVRRALADRLSLANQQISQYFSHTAPVVDITIFNSALLGYVMAELTLESHGLWRDRADFLNRLIQVCLSESASLDVISDRPLSSLVEDLRDQWVHLILDRSRKSGVQESALAYVLLGSGLAPEEIAGLSRQQYVSDRDQSYLQVKLASKFCPIPLNQWILGKRYGSYTNNPLTKWLKQRKDDQTSLFVLDGQPISSKQISQMWQGWCEGLLRVDGGVPIVLQAQQTWCVEMLMRGIQPENLSILTGWTRVQLQPYIDRSGIKLALAQAMQLDQKSN